MITINTAGESWETVYQKRFGNWILANSAISLVSEMRLTLLWKSPLALKPIYQITRCASPNPYISEWFGLDGLQQTVWGAQIGGASRAISHRESQPWAHHAANFLPSPSLPSADCKSHSQLQNAPRICYGHPSSRYFRVQVDYSTC